MKILWFTIGFFCGLLANDQWAADIARDVGKWQRCIVLNYCGEEEAL